MDNNDYKVLERLMNKGRSTWAELGELLNLSAPAAADRVHKLEATGVIKGYAAIVDPNAVGCELAALISVTVECSEQRAKFLKKVNELPEILECYHVAGDVDYILKARCTGTKDLERLISLELKAFSGIKTRTMVVLSTLKESLRLPLVPEKD